ncbi:MAG: DUF1579 domain-containing protein [Ignavibacteriaceae bacterium]|jgi:hypothetical protein|nr:DUF1579 domain-containing protein [Ignavibacteriaceae bacterium]
MKKLFSLLFVFLFVASSNNLFAQDEEAGMDPAMMKAWQEYMTPGTMHELLAKSVGEWKTEIKSWMDPNMPPTETAGKSVCESMLGGRYFIATETANFMGMPFEGSSISGYDNATKKFFSVWIDNMGTGVLNLEGSYDEASKTFTYTGSGMSFTGEYKVREIIQHVNDDESLFTMYMEEGGRPEMKMMEIKYTRIK